MSLAGVARLSAAVVVAVVAIALVTVGIRGDGDRGTNDVQARDRSAARADTRSSADENASEIMPSRPSTSERSADEEVAPERPRAKASKKPLLTSSPRTASSRGAVVAGFPLAVLPVLPGSTVRSSGVSSRSDVVQVSLVATHERSPERILAGYRRILTAYGFVESPSPAVGGSTASAFARGRDHLTVTTTGGSGRTGYSLFGVIRAGAKD
ncbi:hypothetical protein [Aeromicrobium yanjiei]|uniref:Uncharacterized protein n=1 Tax=Aeromicrobium yanjiei TaxID=2662028 RepID=A0A5Q2MGU5_9ACTN|nr:hypothetical protein [Aeromicrobium yanjiei]QGG42367.1 hypothetical protein GEV26_13825 [Aeromicrobium yanjiei]